jgi:hypothetical protein
MSVVVSILLVLGLFALLGLVAWTGVALVLANPRVAVSRRSILHSSHEVVGQHVG